MNVWKRSLTAALCAAVVLAGVWGGLLTDLRCRRDMGLPQPQLPRWQVETENLRRFSRRVGEAEWLLPRGLRGAGLWLLWGAALAEEDRPPADGRKWLV